MPRKPGDSGARKKGAHRPLLPGSPATGYAESWRPAAPRRGADLDAVPHKKGRSFPGQA